MSSPASRSHPRREFGSLTNNVLRKSHGQSIFRVDLEKDSSPSEGSGSDDVVFLGEQSKGQSVFDRKGSYGTKASKPGVKISAPALRPERDGDASGCDPERIRHGAFPQLQQTQRNHFHRKASAPGSVSADAYDKVPPLASQSFSSEAVPSPQRKLQDFTKVKPRPPQQRPPTREFEAHNQITPPSSRFDTSGNESPKSDIMGRSGTRKPVTPKKTDWTVDKLADSLQERSRDMRKFYSDLVAYTINSVPEVEWRVKTGKDLFVDIKHDPIPAEEERTDEILKIKVKHHTRGKNTTSTYYYRPILLKTDKPRVPKYRFHHKEIARNVLTPNTMLKFVPVIRDLNPGEDAQYNTWLKELDRMDASCGFKPMGSREQRVIQTTRRERTSMVALYLDYWLGKLVVDGCNRSALIRHVVRSESDEEITPRQKSIIDSIHSGKNQPASPQTARIAQMFTEAFDRVFAGESVPEEKKVTLRDVLLLDRTVDDIVESKKTVKGPSQESVEDESFEAFIDTYTIMGCLICYSNSCEHGDYGQHNMKRNYSLDCTGKLGTLFVKTPEAVNKIDHDGTLIEPCRRECFMRHGDGGSSALEDKPWSTNDDMLLKTIYAAVECSTRVKSNPQCMVAELLSRKCWQVHRRLVTFDLQLPEDNGPRLPRAKNLPWYDRQKKMLMNDWQSETSTHDHKLRVSTDPCHHDGPCSEENGCECVINKVMCERFCRCTAENCSYKFTGCACSPTGKTCLQRQKEGRPCVCVQLNRECDPLLCKGCGVEERAHPKNRENDAIMETGCQNCVLQRGRSKALAPGKSQLEGCGYGLFAVEDIAQHEFVIEYTGELIMHDEGVRREARRGEAFDNEGSVTSYVFSLLDSEGIWVDAAIYGNHSRYINHEDDDFNVEPKIMYVNGEYRIRFTANRNIHAGEELFFNYGGSFPNLTKKMIKDKTQGTDAEAAAEGPSEKRGPGRRSGKGVAKGTKRSQTVRKEAPQTRDGLNTLANLPPKKGRKRKRDAEDDEEEEEYHPSMGESDSKKSSKEPQDREIRRRGRPRLRSLSPVPMVIDESPTNEGAGVRTRRRGAASNSAQPEEERVERETDMEMTTPTRPPRKRGRPRRNHNLQQNAGASPKGSDTVGAQGPTTPAKGTTQIRGSRSLRRQERAHEDEIIDSDDEDEGEDRGEEADEAEQKEEGHEEHEEQEEQEEQEPEEDSALQTPPAKSKNAAQLMRSESGQGGGRDDSESADESSVSASQEPRSTSRTRRERRLPARYRDDEEL